MKNDIIQTIKLVINNAHAGDIIEVNVGDEKLKNPPLIPFCEVVKINIDEISILINEIEFHESVHSNLLCCVAAAVNRMARQSTYYTDFFFFCDNPHYLSTKTAVQKSAVRLMKDTRSIRIQMFVFNDQTNFDREHFNELGISRVSYLYDNNTPDNYGYENGNRRPLTIICERSHSSQEPQTSEPITRAICNNQPRPVSTHTIVR